MARRKANPPRRTAPTPTRSGVAEAPVDDDLASWLGERLRRIALGMTAALIVARAFWPSEWSNEVDAGDGLGWVGAILVTAAVAIAGLLLGGTTRLRWSWADAAVYALMFLVGLSASHGAERRLAINLAWEWGGLGIAYALVRNLPRTRGESSTLAGAIVATAVAVSAYGLYQAQVELPRIRALYNADPMGVMRRAQIDPDPTMVEPFRNRLMNSNEPMSTFALANSLAGFLVGPLVLALAVGWEDIRGIIGRAREGGSWEILLESFFMILGAMPVLVLLICLLLTKSRSAYLGLAIGVLVLAWRERRRVSARALALAGTGLVGLVVVLVAVGIETGRLDSLVLTQSTLSLKYRWEYWQGTWATIWDGPRTWWAGLGPGNFRGGYLRHKLAVSSEEIADPHNLVLEAWATAGIGAALALLAALGFAFRDLFGPPIEPVQSAPPAPRPKMDEAPARSGWLLACAGGSWLLVVLMGWLDPFSDLLARWLILGGAGVWAALMGATAWRRGTVPAAGLGAASLAVTVNLIAAGGIGIPTVALGLWTWLALGQNLRDDRPCGRLREAGGRRLAFGLAVVWSALVGTFIGAITPFWEAQAAMAEADAALRAPRPDVERARDTLDRAIEADAYGVRPRLALIDLEFRSMMDRGAPPGDPTMLQVRKDLIQAKRYPRNRDSLAVERRRSDYARALLRLREASLPPALIRRLRSDVLDASRRAAQHYPTSPRLRADLAETLADFGRTQDAAREAERALQLDAATPHRDKKLTDRVRDRLQKLK